MKYLKNEEEAKDAVQQIFLKVLGEAGKYKIDYFKSWLYMVAKNHCLMRLRSMQGKNTKEITEQLPLAAAQEDKAEVLENERTLTLLEQSVSELSEEQQQCVTLFYLQKKSYGQICEHTGFSMMQVKSYIQNGKRNLKLLLERKMNESSLKK
jgi:RNA polymerase sigma-70 factor (ECF subfamily)